MRKRFFLIEITDPEISELLLALRSIFSGEPLARNNVHLTVRGPYTRQMSQRTFRRLEEMIEGDTLRIGGVGLFGNAYDYVVYLHVRSDKKSKNLKEIWHKPSYPIKVYGFNPHITLFEGRDLDLAKRICSFLRREKLEFETREFQLIWHTSGQPNLGASYVSKAKHRFPRLVASGQVKKGILVRARKMVQTISKRRHGAEDSGDLFTDYCSKSISRTLTNL